MGSASRAWCFRIGLIATIAALTEGIGAQVPGPNPEAIIRQLVLAMYSNDVATYEKLTIADPRRQRLIAGGSVNADAVRELKADPDAVQVKNARPYLFRGKAVEPDPKGDYPVGTSALYKSSYRSGPMMVSLVRRPEGWKIDVRWWLAMTDLMSGRGPQPGSADYTVRAFLAALVRLDRREAAKYVASGASLDFVFAGAPSQREPSGVYDALVGEMPLVKIGPGEFAVLPSGLAIEGSQTDDLQVLVGHYGSIETAFVLRRAGSSWRVEPQAYLPHLMR